MIIGGPPPPVHGFPLGGMFFLIGFPEDINPGFLVKKVGGIGHQGNEAEAVIAFPAVKTDEIAGGGGGAEVSGGIDTNRADDGALIHRLIREGIVRGILEEAGADIRADAPDVRRRGGIFHANRAGIGQAVHGRIAAVEGIPDLKTRRGGKGEVKAFRVKTAQAGERRGLQGAGNGGEISMHGTLPGGGEAEGLMLPEGGDQDLIQDCVRAKAEIDGGGLFL